jgi:putative membrane protein
MKSILAIAILVAGAVCAQTNRADEAFLKKAAEGGLAEVKFGELAQNSGTSSAVKRFGERMVTDHTRMNEEVQNLAAQKNISLPTSVSVKDEASYKLLQARSGASFDKAYVRDMIKDHKADIAEFEKEANTGSDPDIKTLASKALPTLLEHLRLAENAAKDLGMAPTGE